MSMEQKLRLALGFADEQIIHETFNEIYISYGKLVFFTISKYIENRNDVEYLTQEVFLNFFNVLNKTEIKNIKYYLVTSAKNTAINFLRNKKIEFELDERILFETLCDKEEWDSCIDIIKDLKSFLNKEEVYIILQHALYDKSFKEISNECGKHISTVMAKYYRSINKIRKRGIRKWEFLNIF